jgi:nucleotide-binding universal stress UspA family protein
MQVDERPAGGWAAPDQVADAAVVVAYDGSPQAAAALRWGAHEAMAQSVPLDLVTAWQRPPLGREGSSTDPAGYAQQLGARAAATVPRDAGARLQVRRHVQEGFPTSVVLQRAHGARLLVMGTAGHVGRIGAVLGSVSRRVVERVDVPVVLLGPEAVGHVESRLVVVARCGAMDPWAVSWAVQRARRRPGRTLHLLDTWSAPGQGLGMAAETTWRQARRQAEAAHTQALSRLRRLAGDVPLDDALLEGRAADVERAHGLPGDLLVVAARDVEQRPSLSHLRCPVAIVPRGLAGPARVGTASGSLSGRRAGQPQMSGTNC